MERRGWLLLLAGGVFALVVAFMALEHRVGGESAAVILAALCIVAGLVCLSMPQVLNKFEAAAAPTEPATLAETSADVHEEMTQAVDYFGAIRVVASAFRLGFGAAKLEAALGLILAVVT